MNRGLNCAGKLTRRRFLACAGALPWSLGTAAAIAQSAASDAKPDRHEALRRELERVRQEHQLPAIAAGATLKGQVKALAATGLKKAGSAARVHVDDRFHIGSCTKAMTATLAGLMVQDGKLRWDATLASVFSDRKSAMDAAYQAVTLKMLLTHRAGLPANGTDYGPASASNTERRLVYMDNVLRAKPENTPGSKFVYSNAGYIIAGAMIERVSGVAWEQMIRKRLFEPLGMASAGFGPPSTPSNADQPWGHIWQNSRFVPRYGDNPAPLGPAGTVHCSVRDYLRFADLHASTGRKPPGLLDASTAEFLRQPPKDSGYALGWLVVPRSWARGMMLTHTGSNTMNFFRATLAPDIEFSAAVAINAAGPKVEAALEQVTAFLVRNHAI